MKTVVEGKKNESNTCYESVVKRVFLLLDSSTSFALDKNFHFSHLLHYASRISFLQQDLDPETHQQHKAFIVIHTNAEERDEANRRRRKVQHLYSPGWSFNRIQQCGFVEDDDGFDLLEFCGSLRRSVLAEVAP